MTATCFTPLALSLCCASSAVSSSSLSGQSRIGALPDYPGLTRFSLPSESPKFLVSKGRDEEAITIVHQIAKFNKTSSSLSIESFYDLERKVSHGTASDSDRSTPELESGVNDPLSKNRAVPKKLYDLSHLKILFSSWKIGLLTLLVFLIYMYVLLS